MMTPPGDVSPKWRGRQKEKGPVPAQPASDKFLRYNVLRIKTSTWKLFFFFLLPISPSPDKKLGSGSPAEQAKMINDPPIQNSPLFADLYFSLYIKPNKPQKRESSNAS
jgi:hypothetical protein